MNVRQAYDRWAAQYDSNRNKTRDLEALALRETLSSVYFDRCLEIGCGTGKNTEWLATKAQQIVAVDLSEEMLKKARQKIQTDNIQFLQADITLPWSFVTQPFDLISFSLVLEHIENLENIFHQASGAITKGGHLYIGELHPFKQYTGTKARFDTSQGRHILTCFNHHLSDFTHAAKKHGFALSHLDEYFDDQNQNSIPRILTLLFRKP